LKQSSYDSEQTLKVFQNLGFEIIKEIENEFVYYLYHKIILEEIIVDKVNHIDYKIIKKQLGYIKLNSGIFDYLYENLS